MIRPTFPGPNQAALALTLAFVSLLVAACDATDARLEEAALGRTDEISTTGASLPSASAVECRDTIGAVTVEAVVVPDGARCTLQGTTVQHDVSVNPGATLVARGVSVGGNVQANGAASVLLHELNGHRSTVGGDVQISHGGRAAVGGTGVHGNVRLDQNAGRLLITENHVGGNLEVNHNTGGVRIVHNTVAQTLQCQGNTPPPVGGGNVAAHKVDQCVSL